MPENVFRYKQFSICQDHAAMKVGTDSDLLGTLAAGGNRILDIGTGTGVLSLMLAQRCPKAEITAIEMDENAVLDAQYNFKESPFHDRIHLVHTTFQNYILEHKGPLFDSIVCNPPYFDTSLVNPDLSRARARHSSSLPFSVLVQGSFALLEDEGVFSTNVPPEVLPILKAEAELIGFQLQAEFQIKSVPQKGPKRYILVYKKGHVALPKVETYCMRNTDHSRSEWYIELMKDFHVPGKGYRLEAHEI